MYIYTNIYNIHAHIYINKCVCVCVCAYIHIYVYTYLFIFIYNNYASFIYLSPLVYIIFTCVLMIHAYTACCLSGIGRAYLVYSNRKIIV